MNRPPPGTPCFTWLPPADEHKLAMSLGLIDQDRQTYMTGLAAIEAEAERQGFTVTRGRWRVYRVVYQLSSLGLLNAPGARATAYAHLATQKDQP